MQLEKFLIHILNRLNAHIEILYLKLLFLCDKFDVNKKFFFFFRKNTMKRKSTTNDISPLVGYLNPSLQSISLLKIDSDVYDNFDVNEK